MSTAGTVHRTRTHSTGRGGVPYPTLGMTEEAASKVSAGGRCLHCRGVLGARVNGPMAG
jgi:hypothetical protein